MFWLVTILIGAVLLSRVGAVERETGATKTLARYACLAVIGISLGIIYSTYIAV